MIRSVILFVIIAALSNGSSAGKIPRRVTTTHSTSDNDGDVIRFDLGELLNHQPRDLFPSLVFQRAFLDTRVETVSPGFRRWLSQCDAVLTGIWCIELHTSRGADAFLARSPRC